METGQSAGEWMEYQISAPIDMGTTTCECAFATQWTAVKVQERPLKGYSSLIVKEIEMEIVHAVGFSLRERSSMKLLAVWGQSLWARTTCTEVQRARKFLCVF